MRTAASAPTAAARWTRFDEARGWPAANARPFTSRGHGAGRYSVDVRVDASSRDAYVTLLPGTALADGALLAAFHHDPKRGQPGPIYVMEKLGGAWRFSVVGADGKLERSGELELCQRCHAEAVSDQVFGLPASARPALDGGD